MGAGELLSGLRDYLDDWNEPRLRDWFSGFDWNLPGREMAPASLPAVAHLAGISALAGAAERRLVAVLEDGADALHWVHAYSPEDFGQNFYDNYAHVELFGPQGHFLSSGISGGFVLFGPGIDYPDHWHTPEEIHIPLTGTGLWSEKGGPHRRRDAGDMLYRTPNMLHAMRTQADSLLAIWLWRGENLEEKISF